MSWEFALTIVGNGDLTFLTGLHRCLGVSGDCAATTGNGLIDYQRLIAYISECECAFLNTITLEECSEVVGHLIELDLCLGRCELEAAEGKQDHC